MPEKFTCSICSKEVEEYGNNPQPFPGDRCCDRCNAKCVIPIRMARLRLGLDARWPLINDNGEKSVH